jgi:RNA recognition motif-containing protein
VKNLARSVRKQDLEDLFDKFGLIENAVIVKDPNTRYLYRIIQFRESRGFGFIYFKRRLDAMDSIQALDGTHFKGK